MEPELTTPRLRLTLLTTAERGQPEFDWLHELLSDEKTTWWSLSGRSKSMEDTEQKVKNYLPIISEVGEKQHRVVYAVHTSPVNNVNTEETKSTPNDQPRPLAEFIGLVNLVSVGSGGLALPEHLTLPASAAATTLTMQIAYQFLPKGWGVGYATEAVNAVLEACSRASTFWSPYPKLYVRAIVNIANGPSMRVMDKVGMSKKGVFEWEGEAVFLCGEWRTRDEIVIYGKYLIE